MTNVTVAVTKNCRRRWDIQVGRFGVRPPPINESEATIGGAEFPHLAKNSPYRMFWWALRSMLDTARLPWLADSRYAIITGAAIRSDHVGSVGLRLRR